jgi:peptidoglycan-N-acetylglucosamine deacetylase
MWWAGVGWLGDSFEMVIRDDTGHTVIPETRFRGNQLDELISRLNGAANRAPGSLAVILESTNGLLDGWLLAAGLDVYRVDPWNLPGRNGLASVPARTLAALGTNRPALTRLHLRTGTLAGRVYEVLDSGNVSAEVRSELARANRCVWRGDEARPEVALTFDDGPDPVHTPRILDILRDYGVAATFFCVGFNVSAYPGLVARIADEGHAVGNHTWSHPLLSDLSLDETREQIRATNEVVANAAGEVPALLRPPYGVITPDGLRLLAGDGMTTVLWDVDTGDWGRPGSEAIVTNALDKYAAGSIFLMHDAGGDRSDTVGALASIIEAVLARGHNFVRADRLTLASLGA